MTEIASPETESLIFDILHNVLLTAERAVKIMKHQQKNKEEDEMIRVRKRTTITEQVAPDSAEGNFMIRSSLYGTKLLGVKR